MVENLPVIGLIGLASAVCVLLLVYVLYASKKTEQELDALRAALAHRLGFRLERTPEKKVHASFGGLARGTEVVNWRISGRMEGRDVKLESRSHRTRGMGPYTGMAMTLLLVSCRMPEDLSVVAVILGQGEVLESNVAEDVYYPHPTDPKKRIGIKVKGAFDPDLVSRTDMMAVMTQPGLVARLDVGKGWITLFYEFGDGRRNIDHTFVERAIHAAMDLARKIERL
jgi:hypothetical protein